MTVSIVDLENLAEAARAAGLDGTDRGAVRRLVWGELGTDAIDHAVVEEIAVRLLAA